MAALHGSRRQAPASALCGTALVVQYEKGIMNNYVVVHYLYCLKYMVCVSVSYKSVSMFF